MSVPMLVLTAGASIGLGAVSAPAVATVLSKPITGQVVPTRITDLAGYLMGGADKARGLDSTSGVEDSGAGQSFGTPASDLTGIEDSGAGQSFDTSGPATVAVTSPASTGSTANAQRGGAAAPSGTATADQKRLLAVASFGIGLAIATASFFLIRRVLQ